MLQHLRAALDSAQSVADVDDVAARWDNLRSEPVGRLGNAFIELRRGSLTNDRNILVAAWEGFDQAVRSHPDWPYARLGLAEAALVIYSRRYPLPANYDDVAGGTHYDGYTIQMNRALRAEPEFQPAVTWLAGTMSAEGDREQPGVILKALQFIADSTRSTDPRIPLILARAERLQGDAAQSLPRIAAFLREGGDSGIAALETARSLAWMGRLGDGATNYLAGAQVRTADARAAYRLDLSWVGTWRELARYDSLPADSIGSYIEGFWGKRDVQELRPGGSRLQEHLRRWVYVNQYYRVPDPERRTAYREVFIPPTDAAGNPLYCLEDGARSLDDYDYTEPARQGGYRSPERVFDHRAIVYMRHGEPLYQFGGSADSLSYSARGRANAASMSSYDASRQRLLYASTPPFASMNSGLMAPNPDRNVTWVYMIGGRLRVFTFLGHQALGSGAPSTLIVNTPPNLDVMLHLAALSSSYSRLAAQTRWNAFGGSIIPGSCQQWYRDVVREQRNDAAVAVSTDTYLRRFAQPLAAAIQLSAMGQPAAGTGELLAVLGIRTSELAGQPVPGDTGAVRFVVRLQVAAIDSLTGESVRADTVREFLGTADMVQRHAWLTFITKLAIRPGLKDVRLSVEQDDDRGSVFAAVIDPADTGFSASDLVLGNEGGAVPWRRNGETVQVSPFSFYRTGENVPIYYELYGLTSGGAYRTTVSLRRAGDSKLASSLTSTDVATTATVASTRTLTLNKVKPGRYDLILSIEEVTTGRRVARQRAISVDGD